MKVSSGNHFHTDSSESHRRGHSIVRKTTRAIRDKGGERATKGNYKRKSGGGCKTVEWTFTQTHGGRRREEVGISTCLLPECTNRLEMPQTASHLIPTHAPSADNP